MGYIERLDFNNETAYNSIEASIHLNRYLSAKQYVVGKRVLDIACGEGYGSYLLKSWGAESVVGVDISEVALNNARNYFADEGITFVKNSAEQLPFGNDSFDVIVSFETIEHLEDPESFLREIARVARYNATILISCPNDPYFSKNEDNFSNPFHKRKYTWFEFKELSESILGEGEQWYFGFGIGGFANIPLSETKQPENDSLPQSMMEMLQFDCSKYSAVLKPSRYLNHWNASYYLAIWGKSPLNEYAVIYPQEVFLPEDSNYWTDLERINRMYEKKLEEMQINEKSQTVLEEKAADLALTVEQLTLERNRLQKQLHVQTIEWERTSNLLKLANEEKQYLWLRIGKHDAESNVLRSERDALRDEIDYLKNAKAIQLVFWFWRIRDRIFGKKRG